MRTILLWMWLQQRLGFASHLGSQLFDFTDCPRFFFDSSPEELAAAGVNPDIIRKLGTERDLSRAERDYTIAMAHGYRILTPDDDVYPHCLRTISNPPLVLYVNGDVTALHHPHKIGIVGTRHSSKPAEAVAQELGFRLCREGAALVSGCAYGIDAAAHTGALLAQGINVGVLGCGIDVKYNKKSEGIRKSILRSGALISEYPPGSAARAEHFPQRNRIITALSQSITVVEGSGRSGSFITASKALEQGKPVYAYSRFVPMESLSQIDYYNEKMVSLFDSPDELITMLEEQLPEQKPALPKQKSAGNSRKKAAAEIPAPTGIADPDTVVWMPADNTADTAAPAEQPVTPEVAGTAPAPPVPAEKNIRTGSDETAAGVHKIDSCTLESAVQNISDAARSAANVSTELSMAAVQLSQAIDSGNEAQIARNIADCADILGHSSLQIGGTFGQISSASASISRTAGQLAGGAVIVTPEQEPVLHEDPLFGYDLSDEARKIYCMLREQLETHDSLAEKLGWNLSQVSGYMLELEMLGLVDSLPGGRYATTATPYGEPVIPQ